MRTQCRLCDLPFEKSTTQVVNVCVACAYEVRGHSRPVWNPPFATPKPSPRWKPGLSKTDKMIIQKHLGLARNILVECEVLSSNEMHVAAHINSALALL